MKRILTIAMQVALAVAFVLSSTHSLWAQDEKPWKDTAELSYVQTGGNTDIVTFSGSNSLDYKFSQRWSASWKISALSAETDSVKTAERYSTDLRTDYNASENIYLYGLGGWSQDKFAGIDTRYYLGPGAGYKILTGDRHLLSVEGGLSYAHEKYVDETENDFLEGRLLGNYEYHFNTKNKFSQTVEYLHNFDDSAKYRVKSVTAITTMLTDIFSLKISYELDYNNKPTPETLEQTDTIFSAALVANF